MSFRTPVENPGTRPLRSRAFGVGCALFAALAAFGSFSLAQAAHPALPTLPVSLVVAVLTALVLPLRRVWPVPGVRRHGPDSGGAGAVAGSVSMPAVGRHQHQPGQLGL